jgi:hypothetical protein
MVRSCLQKPTWRQGNLSRHTIDNLVRVGVVEAAAKARDAEPIQYVLTAGTKVVAAMGIDQQPVAGAR